MGESSAESSSETDQSSTKEKAPEPPKPVAEPAPVFKPSRQTDNDTYFDKHFKPLNGDIILHSMLEFEPKDPKASKAAKKTKKFKAEPPPLPVLAKKAVTLFNEDFDESQLRPGDLILRIGLLEMDRKSGPQARWTWKDLEMATVHVYWPNYHSLGNWFEVTDFPMTVPLPPIVDPDVFRPARDFKKDPNFKEAGGDVVIRRERIQDPTRPWGWTFDGWQLQERWAQEDVLPGDILVRASGQFFADLDGKAQQERQPVFKLKEPLFRIEVDCSWLDPTTSKRFYVGQDVHCFRIRVVDEPLKHERFGAVPKPGDILITQGQNLLRPLDEKNPCKGGFVHIYDDRRFFYPGDPPLKPVNVKGPGNMAIRFGHFDRSWKWTPHPSLELFHYHEGEGAWYTLGPVVLTYKWMVAPDYAFELNPQEVNSVAANFVPARGDILIRKPRSIPTTRSAPPRSEQFRDPSYFEVKEAEAAPNPFWKCIRKIVPYSSHSVQKYPLVEGDCVLRSGIEPAGEHSRAKYNAVAELYMLVLDHLDRLVWVFRGRDKTTFGAPEAKPRVEEEASKPPTLDSGRSSSNLPLPCPEPLLARSNSRGQCVSERTVEDVLIEKSVWNFPGPMYASAEEFRGLLIYHDDKSSVGPLPDEFKGLCPYRNNKYEQRPNLDFFRDFFRHDAEIESSASFESLKAEVSLVRTCS